MGKIGRHGVCAAIAMALLWLPVTGPKAQALARVTLPGHVPSALARATPFEVRESAAMSASDEPVAITVIMRRTDQAGFDRYLADVYNRASPIYRKFLTPLQIAETFGPSQQDYDAVRAYFEAQGFSLGEGSANRMTLVVNGSRAGAASALAVAIKDYRIGRRTFYANDAEPSLPPDIARRVEAVIGLSNLAVPKANSEAIKSALCKVYAEIASLTGYTQYKDGLPVKVYEAHDPKLVDKLWKDCMIDQKAKGYADLAKADPPPPAWQGADGTGQKIGVVAFDTLVLSDIADYLTLIDNPGTINNVSQVHVNGGATPGASQDEVLLDVDEILSTAPGAKVVVYDGPFAGSGASFQAIFNAMINGGVDIISNSWAYCEDQTTLADVQSIDTILQTAAASGISAVTGSGDHGSSCLDGSPNTVHVPASSPHITAVGASSLTLGPGNTYQSETWWDGSVSSPPGGQGGFGVSQFFARPAYQNGLSAVGMRSIPDVVSNGDPVKGAQICQASAGGCPSGLYYGGTSKSAPSWAAFAAKLNQTQGSNLGFLNPLIYPLANTDAFHTAASMGSDFAHVGLGSPNLARLHQRLTSQTPGAVSASVSILEAFTANGGFSAPNVLGLPVPGLADGSTQDFLVVRLADANGNIVSGKTINLSANPSGNVVISPASGVSDGNNGAVIFTVTNLTQETVTFTATDATDGIALQDAPSVAFLIPPASAASINASPSPVPSDGVSTTTITVSLKDALGRPTPGKLIQIDQSAGHSIISGPSPAATDLNGQIQFTATDGVSESVVYTAIDVTDGNLPVPGSATVSFTGGTTSCVGAPPVAASGFTIAPWATGFFAENFFYGGVNWGGCGGASNPTFTSSGTALIADFPSGDLFKLPPAGGAAAGTKLSNLTPTLTQPTFGKDGRLYAAHGSTGGGFTTGDIVEIDPTTGAQIRVVASNLTCPNALSIDPLSGDLFFDDDCFGAGSDNPSIWRIHDPGGAATLSVYATLPTTPSGQMAFSPDGTLYAVTGYTGVRQVVRIGGTNSSSPPSMTTLSGITSFFCLTMGQVQGDGSAKSLIVCDGNGVELVDITTNPFTSSMLISAGGSGTIGPDGCLYSASSDTIYKLTEADGNCGFAPTNPAPLLALTPASASPAQGGTQSLTATFTNVSVPAGTPVIFAIAGAHFQLKLGTTDAAGAATVTYVGSATGIDTVVASGPVGSSTLTSNPATITWGAGKQLTFVDLSTSPSGGIVGQPVTVRAALSDITVDPPASIAGAAIHFTLGAASCDGTTNAQGVASCSLTPFSTGQPVLFASYAGSLIYASASASEAFGVVAAAGNPPGPPTIDDVSAGDGSITLTFTPPTDSGGSAITSYTALCTPDGGGAPGSQTGNESPITVSGLTNGATYTCTVTASNGSGPGAPSGASNPITLSGSSALGAQPIPALSGRNELLLSLLILVAALAALGSRRSRARSKHRYRRT